MSPQGGLAVAKQDVNSRPMAVIDIGANSVRMVVAQVADDGHTEVLERTQRPVRLGHDTFVAGRLSQQAMNAAIAILRDYNKVLSTYGVQSTRAVATSAVREASNGDSFVDRVTMAVGIDIHVLDPAEESLLTVSAVRQAVKQAIDLGHSHALVVDVGGGSTLLSVLEGGVIAETQSHSLGSIRLQEYLATTHEPLERAVALLRRRIANVGDIIRRSMPVGRVAACVAVGDDARFAATHAGHPVPNAGLVATVDRQAFDQLVEACAHRSPQQLATAYGLPFPNAERLVPALLIYQEVLHSTSVDPMFVCNVSMLDGLLLDMARRVAGKEDPELAESIVRSAKTIARRYRADENHADHVAALATDLFDALQREHGLTPRHRLLLRVATILHEIGKFVSNRAHHKHAYYLVSNSEVFGLSRVELQIVAHVARYHRRALPRPAHLDYMSLPREQRIVVNKLAALLRVADALDRGHAQQITGIRVEPRQVELVIHVTGVADLTIERRAIAEKADLFEETYGMHVRIEQTTSPTSDDRRASPVG